MRSGSGSCWRYNLSSDAMACVSARSRSGSFAVKAMATHERFSGVFWLFVCLGKGMVRARARVCLCVKGRPEGRGGKEEVVEANAMGWRATASSVSAHLVQTRGAAASLLLCYPRCERCQPHLCQQGRHTSHERVRLPLFLSLNLPRMGRKCS